MQKYRCLRETLSADQHQPWRFHIAPPASRSAIELAHDHDYVARVFNGELSREEIRLIGFPWSEALLERSRRSVGATLAASAFAEKNGIAASLAGGTHHATRGAGAGFCVFNDVAIAALVSLKASAKARVLVVDTDVHQGDGSAEILAAHDRVVTFSMHCARNFPHRKQTSVIDVELPDHTGDADYLEILERALEYAIELARPSHVLVVAGADIYVNDRLGRLAVSARGIAARDRYMFTRLRELGVATTVVMGGGYAPELNDIVAIHAQTVRSAAACWQSV